MRQLDYSRFDGCAGGVDATISRRAAMGSSVLAVLAIATGPALPGQPAKGADRQEPPAHAQERMQQSKAFIEQMRNAGSAEERMKIMEERRVQDRRRAIEDFKERLGMSDKEWAVVRPRLEAVYNLKHPPAQVMGPGERPRDEVQQRSSELRELLRDEDAPVDRVKAALTALRAAKEKVGQRLAAAQQDLRQLMTIRQEAMLVLNGLLE